MTVTLPTPDNDYQAPLGMALSKAVWNAVFASVGSRIRALEANTADYDAVVGELQTQALAVISATITDEITARRADFDALDADAAALADEIAAIRAGGIDAVNVSLTTIAGLAAANAQAAISELLDKIEAEVAARNAAIAAEVLVRESAIAAEAGVRAAAIAAIPIAGQHDFIANGPIAQGKAVLLQSDGKVAQSVISNTSIGSAVNLSANNASAVSTCYDPAHDRFVVFWRDDSNGFGKAAVCTITGAAVAIGSPVTFSTGSLNVAFSMSIDSCYDPDRGQIIVAYLVAGTVRLKACTLTGTTLSFGAELATGFTASGVGICYDMSVDRALIAFHDGSTGSAAVIANSGIVLSTVTSSAIMAVNGYTAAVVHCEGYPTPGYNVVCFNSGGSGRIMQARINPTTFALTFVNQVFLGAIMWGKAIAWSKAFQRLLSLDSAHDISKVLRVSIYIIASYGMSYVTSFAVGSVNSYAASYQNFPSIACFQGGEAFAVVWPNAAGSYYGKIKLSSAFSASGAALGPEIIFQSSNVGWTSVAFDADGKTGVLTYSPGSAANTGPGKSAVVTPRQIDRRAGFVGFSQEDAVDGGPVTVTLPLGTNENQSGLTPGASYYLSASDGSTLTTTVNGPRVGKALNSTDLLVLGSNILEV